MNARSVARLGLLPLGLAVSASVACGAQELFPATNTLVNAASGVERVAVASADGGGAVTGQIATNSGTPAQYMGGGCEKVRKPNCNRPGRRSTHR